MKILLLGDASNCHRTLATGLRNLGHEVVVVSDGTAWMQTERDIDISRRGTGKLGGLSLYLRMLRLCATRLRGFDVVAVHNPIFLKLRPLPVRHIFSLIKRNNRSVFLTALGTDTPYVEECLDPLSPLEYNEFRHYGHQAPYALNHPDRAGVAHRSAQSALRPHLFRHRRGCLHPLRIPSGPPPPPPGRKNRLCGNTCRRVVHTVHRSA